MDYCFPEFWRLIPFTGGRTQNELRMNTGMGYEVKCRVRSILAVSPMTTCLGEARSVLRGSVSWSVKWSQ